MIERCGYDCDCDTIEDHDQACERSMEEFLRDPGLPPSSMSKEDAARALKAIEKEKHKRLK